MLGGAGLHGGVVTLALSACVLRSTTKTGHQILSKNVHPRENPGYAYEYNIKTMRHQSCALTVALLLGYLSVRMTYVDMGEFISSKVNTQN